jgi:hypothetical protein
VIDPLGPPDTQVIVASNVVAVTRPVMRIVFGWLGAHVSSKAPSGRTLMVWQHHVTLLPAHGETSIPGGDGSKNTS